MQRSTAPAERLAFMLLGNGERPRRSSMGKAASAGSSGLVVALRDAAHKFWEDNEEDEGCRIGSGSTMREAKDNSRHAGVA